MGYIKETIGYYFYHPIEQKLFFSKHVAFIEKKIIHVKEYLLLIKALFIFIIHLCLINEFRIKIKSLG
jgi:hypothetical protein